MAATLGITALTGLGRAAAGPTGAAGRFAGAAGPERSLQVNALQALCRQVFAFRLVMIALGAPLALGGAAPGGPAYLVGGAVLLTFMVSYALFRDWERFGPLLLRHRWLLAPDMALSALLLVTATPESPLGLVCVCTPLLAGLVYGWRGSAPYAAVQAVAVALVADGLLLATLCLLAGAAGACLRDLLFRFGSAGRALTQTRARLAVAEAVRAERDHLAREMHDSVSKTLHGLALAADALSRTTDPEAARHQAELIAGAARRAAAESRALLTDLRRDLDLDAPGISLTSELRALCTGDGVEFRVSGVLPVVPSAVARHLVAVVSEALENARRHADARRVVVEAAVDGPRLTVTVEDDGRGLPDGAPDPSALHREGHFGLLGMTERAKTIGATLTIGRGAWSGRGAGAGAASGPGTATGPGSGPGPGTRVRLDLLVAALTPERGSP
ncbi:sensor histidine kinase [Streptomyces sp. NBC_01408]|uniref:sensor histidine kinase n=1 Tax=Streptomyces sp. NBC_01408 TaxID=2903855 RepID=UPI00225B1C4E|nr:histidine kinase [Streptomyces sp. NBC_01408]MCX4691299.1 histidine kinase [Streptomyces sp. NBC_01408]